MAEVTCSKLCPEPEPRDDCMLPLQLQAHSQNDISDIYRFPLVTKGIFVNPALQEPFGLTVIEVRLAALSVDQCCQPVCCLLLFSMCSAVAEMHPHRGHTSHLWEGTAASLVSCPDMALCSSRLLISTCSSGCQPEKTDPGDACWDLCVRRRRRTGCRRWRPRTAARWTS